MTDKHKSKIQDIYENACVMTKTLLKKKVDSIIGIAQEEKEWKVVVEVVERDAIPDTQDILAKFEIRFDLSGELLGYRRLELRHRSDLEAMQQEEA